MGSRENFDDLAWDENDEAWEKSRKQLRLKSTCRKVEALAKRLWGRRRHHWSRQSSSFPEEKTRYEAAAMAYLAKHTNIPVPTLFYHTPSSDIGPALILQHIKYARDMSDALAIPGQDPEETPVLNPNIEEDTLRKLYQKIAVILSQLCQPTFARIGSLIEDGNGQIAVAGRPITQNMNNMIQLANIPKAVLPEPQQTYDSADGWYTASAEMHMAQLLFQHNDLICSENDCRNKYVARFLFYSLAKQGRLSNFGFSEDDWSAQSQVSKFICRAPEGSDGFQLWCDDLRPVNLLVNQEDDIIAAIDWEFTYVAPTQFSLDPPWWLLLEAPEIWSSGIEHWADVYDERLKTWLLAMEDAEMGATDLPTFKLSAYMRESWSSGRFRLNYATRKSWAFDAIYWKFLDERFFGPRYEINQEDSYWRARMHLLGEKGRQDMETFVVKKMDEIKERILVDWDPTAAKDLLSRTLEKGPQI